MRDMRDHLSGVAQVLQLRRLGTRKSVPGAYFVYVRHVPAHLASTVKRGPP